MSIIYKSWKPIRNFLRKTDPLTSLQVIMYYSTFSSKIESVTPEPPSFIEVNYDIMNRSIPGIFPWDMEVLAREIILSCEDINKQRKYDLRKWRYFGNLMEKLRYLENNIVAEDLNTNNILQELIRITHRQFPHQEDALSLQLLVRYGKIYSYPDLEKLFLEKTELSFQKIIIIGIGMLAQFKQAKLIYQSMQNLDLYDVSQNDINTFLKLFSRSFTDLKELVLKEHAIDDTFMYQYSPIYAYPIASFKRNNRVEYVCPSVNRLYWQLTRGLYYMLCREENFDNSFGGAFNNYVGDVLRETSNKNRNYKYYSEEIDPGKRKRRCDWVICQGEEFILVECKTKRMAIGGYSTLNEEELIKQLYFLACAVVQTYQSYIVYLNQGYQPKVFPYERNMKGAICVVTLEKWYLFGKSLKILNDIVIEIFNQKNLDISMLDEVPYEVVSITDFEKIVFLSSKGISIRNIFLSHKAGTESSHELSNYINTNYKKELDDYEYIFKDEINNIIPTV